MTATDTVALLASALDQTEAIIASITLEQSSLPTPCRAWDVRALVHHVIGQDMRNFTISARGETADWQAPADDVSESWGAAFHDRAEVLLDVWRGADLDRPVAMPGRPEAPLRGRADQQITELAVHGWDLVQATGQSIELNRGLAEHALAWSRQALRPEFRGADKAFGPEVAVPDDDASVYDRLAGWFGRDPGWTAP